MCSALGLDVLEIELVAVREGLNDDGLQGLHLISSCNEF